MAKVTIYTKIGCPYCVRALGLLAHKNADVTEIEAASDPARRADMVARSGRSTFPQIFIGDTHIGGCDDLHALEARGALDGMLEAG